MGTLPLLNICYYFFFFFKSHFIVILSFSLSFVFFTPVTFNYITTVYQCYFFSFCFYTSYYARHNNNITVTIPTEIGNLKNHKYLLFFLFFFFFFFTPVTLHYITTIYLVIFSFFFLFTSDFSRHNNNITVTIPTEIGNLINHKYLLFFLFFLFFFFTPMTFNYITTIYLVIFSFFSLYQ